MAIAYKSRSYIAASGSSPTMSEPSGAADGDFLIGLFIVPFAVSSISVPSGWTTLFSGTGTNSQMRYNIHYIVRGSSAPSYSYTMSSSSYREIHIMCFSGVDTTTPIDASQFGSSGNGTNTNPDPPAITPASNDALALAIGQNWSGSNPAWSAPSGYTMCSDNTSGNDYALAIKQLASAASENPGAFSGVNTGSNQDYFSATVTLATAGVISDSVTTAWWQF